MPDSVDQPRPKRSSKELLVGVLDNAERADRAAIARMSMSERLKLALDLSEFAARNSNAAKKP